MVHLGVLFFIWVSVASCLPWCCATVAAARSPAYLPCLLSPLAPSSYWPSSLARCPFLDYTQPLSFAFFLLLSPLPGTLPCSLCTADSILWSQLISPPYAFSKVSFLESMGQDSPFYFFICSVPSSSCLSARIAGHTSVLFPLMPGACLVPGWHSCAQACLLLAGGHGRRVASWHSEGALGGGRSSVGRPAWSQAGQRASEFRPGDPVLVVSSTNWTRVLL